MNKIFTITSKRSSSTLSKGNNGWTIQ